MKREFHVRFDESLGGKFPGATLLALNMLKKENTEKSGIAIKRKMAGWDTDYLIKVLAA